MAETLVADLPIIPELFLPYSVEETVNKSALIQAGIIEYNLDFSRRAEAGFDMGEVPGGQFVNMPFWQALTGTDEVLSDTGSLVTAKIQGAADLAVIHNRGKAWSDNDLVTIIGGSDPQQAVEQMSGAWWEEQLQTLILAVLKGAFASGTLSSNSLDIHRTDSTAWGSQFYLNAVSFIDARQKMGDAKGTLTGAIMHSAVEASLEKNDLIETQRDSEGIEIRFFQGKRVIIDDRMPVEVINGAPVYSTFLFGRGAFAYGVSGKNKPIAGLDGPGGVKSTWGLEWDRQALAGQNIMIQRRRFIAHLRGVKWIGTMAGHSPTNAELSNGASWLRVFEQKNVRVVRVRHNIEM